MRILHLKEVDSTNSYVERNIASLRHGDVVTAFHQTSGRGQRGNSWESNPGENITFTMLLHPEIEASKQFLLSCMVALKVCEVLEEICHIKCKVKWPNDIYAGDDRKICGILISHSLQGRHINHSIVGIGLNINQTTFLSDAPNPVSARQLTGTLFNCEEILRSLALKIEKGTDSLSSLSYQEKTASDYRRNLWRGDSNLYPFLNTSTGEIFHASVEDIEPMGHLVLRDTEDNILKFAFKEVAWL